MEEIQKSSGGYMSVDPVAAVQQNRPLIEQIRQTVQQAPHPAPQPTQLPNQAASTPGK